MSVVTVVLVTFLSLHVFAGELDADRRKVETLAKADRLLGQRYSPAAGKPLRLYDGQTETGRRLGGGLVMLLEPA